MRSGRILLVNLIVLALLAGCGGEGPSTGPDQDREPVSGGTVVIGVISDMDSWNEYLAKQTSSLKVLRRIYMPLARETWGDSGRGPTLEPRIAESWSTSSDGLSVTFNLREMTWSDGTPLTAEDVRFTWTTQIAPEVAWSNADTKSAIRDVRVEDDRTVTFVLHRTYPEAMADIITGGILPRHIFEQVPFAEWPTYDWSMAQVGSGPYLLHRHRPGEEVSLKRNPRFYRPGLPYLDRLVYRIVPDLGNLILQLQAGTVDLVDGIAPWHAEALLSVRSLDIREMPTLGYEYIGWNTTRPPLDDPEVRKALTMAMNREGIVEELLYGHGRVSAGPIPASYRVAVNGTPWPYDPDESKKILAARGFKPKDGILQRDGRPFEIEMMTNAGNELRSMVMVRVQEQLGRIGVKVRLLPPMQMSAFVERNMSGDFDAYVAGWMFDGKVELRTLFASGAVPPGGFNVVRYNSPDCDDAIQALESSPTIPLMTVALQRIHDRIHADQPYTFLFESTRLVASSSRLHDLALDVPGDALANLELAWIDP